MALQDLTPQLRTRLSRLERVVGIFVAIATLLMIAGLAYYIYQRAESKGWGKRRLPYFTFARNAAGLKIGQNVKMMGRDVGTVTDIELQEPGAYYDVYVALEVTEPYDGYLWEDSRAKIAASDFLGNRFIELSKGTNGPPTYIFHPIREYTLDQAASLTPTNSLRFAAEVFDGGRTNLLVKVGSPFTDEALRTVTEAASVTSISLYDSSIKMKRATGLWDFREARYRDPYESAETRKGYFLVPDEAPALNERLETVAGQVERMVAVVEGALPNVLELTNKISRLLDETANTAERADDLLSDAKPIVENLARITDNLTEPNGSLGQWIIPPEINQQLTQALANANVLLTNSDAQITTVAGELDRAIENLADITANLNRQVQRNTNIVSEVSKLIVDTDDMVQGLKRHWLLRSAFKKKPAESKRPPSFNDQFRHRGDPD